MRDGFIRLWLIAFFTVGVYSCTHAVHIPLLKGDIGEAQGMTTCSEDNIPVMFVNSDGTKVEDERLTLIHEKAHAMRMMKYQGGCKAFHARYSNDSYFRFKEEAEAYCAEARVMMYDSRDTLKAIVYVASSVHRYALPGWTTKRVLLELPCLPLEHKLNLPP